MTENRFNPFPGLRPFELHEKHLFFGRETQIFEMLQRLGAARFLAAVGPSGSGKSSLVRAGLIPELLGGANTRAGSHWVVVILRPGGNPMGALATALAESELYAGRLEDGPAHLEATLGRSARGLIEAVRQAHPPPATRVLVVVDQFEELFRFAGAQRGQQQDAEAFVQRLLEAARDPQERLYVVLTMRSDFIGDCARFPGLAEAINQAQYLIPRLTRDQWRAAIEGPVRVGGGTITPRLVQRLLADVADDPDQLPVLQHALMRTWDCWEQGTGGSPPGNLPLDLPHYEAVGGMAGALSRHAEEALNELPDGPLRRIAERLFRALTEKGFDGRGIRRPARFDVLQSACNATDVELGRVAAVFRQPGRTFILPGGNSELSPTTVLDISHESLMRVWTRLSDWVEAESQSAGIYRRLSETAQLWQQKQAGLYRDPELALALRWRETDQPTEGWSRLQRGDFSLALCFLDESTLAAQREREAQEAMRRQELERTRAQAAEQARRARIFGAIAVVMATMVVLMIFAALWLRKLQREATSRELAAHAVNQLKVDPELSVLLAAEAMRAAPLPEAENVLRQALFASPVRARLHRGDLSPGSERIWISEYSPDGTRILTAGTSSNAFLWEAHGGLIAVLRGHTAGITSAGFSTNGLAVTGGNDGTARLWNTTDGRLVAVVPAGDDASQIRTVELSRDGRGLVIASADGTTRIGSGNDWTHSILLTRHSRFGNGAILSPAGDRLFVYGETGGSRLWNLGPPISDSLLPGVPGKITQAAFDADGRYVYAVGAPSTPDFIGWRLDGGIPVLAWPASPISNAVSLVAAHRSPRVLISQREPRVATLRNSTNGVLMTTLTGHRDGLKDAQFSPDDRLIVTASDDKTAQIWNLKGEPLEELLGHEKSVNQGRFSPDGTHVVTASDDGTSRIWAVLTGRESQLSTHPLRDVAFSADGRWAAARDDEENCWRWPTNVPDRPQPPFRNVDHFALSGDGNSMVMNDGLAAGRIWTAKDNSSIRFEVTDRLTASPTLNHDGSLMLWPGGSGAQLWQLKPTLRQLPVEDPDWTDGTSSIETAAFSPDGRWLVTVTSATNLQIWTLTAPPGTDGAVVPHRGRRITNADGFKTLSQQAIAFAPDSGSLICIIDGSSEVQRWSLTSPALSDAMWVARQTGRGAINRVAFSPDGRFLLTASSDGSAGILSADSGYPIAALRGQSGRTLGATFLGGTDAVLTVGENGTIRLYDTRECGPVASLLQLAGQRVTRPLTDAEKRRYLPNAAPPGR